MIFFILLVITNICISYADPTVSQQITEPTPSRALLQKLESQPQDITLRNKVAKQLYSEKQYSKVIEILNPYTEQISIEMYLILAGSYSELKKYDQEVRILKMVAEKDKSNYNSHYILGTAYLKQADATKDLYLKKEDEKQAIISLRKSISINKKFLPPYEALLNLFIENSSNYEARSLLNDMLHIFGQRPSYLNDLCRLLSIDGYLSQAVETCRKAIMASKKFPDNYVYLAQAYSDQKLDKKSESILKIAAKKFQKSEPVQWAAGEFYRKQKNNAVASRYFEMATAAAPHSARANLSYASTLVEMGKEKEALAYFKEACKQSNTSVRSELSSTATKLRLNKNKSLAQEYMSLKYQCQ